MVKNDLVESAKKLANADSCYEGAKVASEKWLESIGTPQEKEAATALLAELKEDVMDMDAYMGFLKDQGAAFFGEEITAQLLEEAAQAKAQGGKWCLCDACQAGADFLENEAVLLGE